MPPRGEGSAYVWPSDDMPLWQLTRTRAESVMSRPPKRIDLEASLAMAVVLLQRHGIHHTVVYDGMQCVGVLSDRDLLRM